MDKKRKGDDLQHEGVKKQRTESGEINYLSLLPTETLLAVAKFAGAFPITLLYLTSKQLHELLDNHWWYWLYRCERGINHTAVDLSKTPFLRGRAEEECYFDRYDDQLTTDGAQTQRELLLDDYCIKYLPDDNFPPEEKEIALKLLDQYDELADYKELAVDEWLRRQHFEIWNDTTCDSLNIAECSCVFKEDLQLYDEDGNELESDANVESEEREFDSADSSFESLADQEDQEDEEDQDEKEQGDQENELKSDEGSEEEGDCAPLLLTAELRDEIIQSVADSAQLNVFVLVLDAAVLGHLPASTCPDSERIAIMKLKHDTVLLGNVIDDVMEQIAHAVHLDSRLCLKTLFCALQKLSLIDLHYLNQGVRARFPYLAHVFAVRNIERSVPLSWFDLVCYNEPHWACDFRASMAAHDELDALPDWLSLRHSMLGLMRSSVASASPSVADHGVNELKAFIAKILQRVVETKVGDEGANDAAIEVDELDILRAVSNDPKTSEFIQPHVVYRTSKLMQESNLIWCADSDCSYASSYSDLSEEEEDLAQFAHENRHNIQGRTASPLVANEQQEALGGAEDLTDHLELTARIKEKVAGLEHDCSPLLMHSAVVYAQTDLTAEQLDDINADEVSECSEEEHVEAELIDWLRADTDNYNPDYIEQMIHTLKQDAAYYAGSAEVGEQAEESLTLLDSVTPADLPDLRPDLTEEAREKILAVRREINRALKEESLREHQEYLRKKYDRLCDNYAQYNTGSVDATNVVTAKSLQINLFSDNTSNITRTIRQAAELIEKNKGLKVVTVRDYNEQGDELESQIAINSLFSAIEASTSIESLQLYGCCCLDAGAVAHLLQHKKLCKFQFVFSSCCDTQDLDGNILLFNELARHSSLRELDVEYPTTETTEAETLRTMNQTIAALSSGLEVLKLRVRKSNLPFLEAPMREWSAIKTIELQFARFADIDWDYLMCDDQEDLRKGLIEAAKPARLIFMRC